MAIFRNYAILSAIMAVNKKKDSCKVCKFHFSTTEKMEKIKFISLVHHTAKGRAGLTRELLHSILLTRLASLQFTLILILPVTKWPLPLYQLPLFLWG